MCGTIVTVVFEVTVSDSIAPKAEKAGKLRIYRGGWPLLYVTSGWPNRKSPHFRPDGVTCFEARYFLETDDGERILLNNRGYSWFRDKEVEQKWDDIKTGKIPGEKAVPPEGYYFRTFPTFEAPSGSKYDWLNRTVIIGTGARFLDGNVIRYYKVV
jgi:hypothetical protein